MSTPSRFWKPIENHPNVFVGGTTSRSRKRWRYRCIVEHRGAPNPAQRFREFASDDLDALQAALEPIRAHGVATVRSIQEYPR